MNDPPDFDDCALIISFDSHTQIPHVTAYTLLSSPVDPFPDESTHRFTHNKRTYLDLYLAACDLPDLASTKWAMYSYHAFPNPPSSSHSVVPPRESASTLLSAKKRYKPVAQKIKSVVASVPEKFRIVRNILGDPLANMPTLDPNPPSTFVPTQRYTVERRNITDKGHPDGFLTKGERDLMHDFMRKQDLGFAWHDSERGKFRTDFFPPIDFPLVPHTPWIQKNIPIPPGLYEDVCALIRQKIDAGVYEPSNSSYRSRWFCVLKKGGKTLRIVHSLEPLNAVTIRHSGVTPIPDHLAEQFANRSCGAMLDLYVGYDERPIADSSRDFTTFQTPYGAKRLVSLPMGWTNSVPIFHDDVTYILQPEIPEFTVPYIDDVAIKGPASRYPLPGGKFETIPQNPDIRRFVWEHFQNVNRVVQRMKYCGGTFSGLKLTLCAPEITVLGHRCSYLGRLPDATRVEALVKWGPCASLSEVRAFLGTIGVCRIFIRNFAHRAHHLVKLTRKDAPFEFGEDQINAQTDLIAALLDSQALRAIDYKSDAPVILAVDTSHIAVGFHLCQCDPDDPRRRHYARFGSITLNDREAKFSQPKLELYGLYRSLSALRLYLIGVRNLIIEVDARYIKGMLANPDIAPSASVNRWIFSILSFHFELVHVPGTNHGPDGLSRRPRQPLDNPPPDTEEFDDWIDRLHSFVHQVNSPLVAEPREISFVATLNLAIAPVSSEEEDECTDFLHEDHSDDDELDEVRKWHKDLKRPADLTNDEYARFLRYAAKFFISDDQLWRKDRHGSHKLFVRRTRRDDIMTNVHDELGHKGLFATRSTLAERFWWPGMLDDIAWFIKSCHLCQIHQTRKLLIPPVVATPAPLFAKIYIDTMHMPASGGYSYIVQGRCSLSFYPEFRMLRRESGTTIGDWIYEDILCRWGSLHEIVTDNGGPFLKALEYLGKRYHIHHIRISGYNSRANGIVERSHFDVRQSLFKAVDGDQKRWSTASYTVFWAERITVRKRMGCSPYYATTGSHPLIPLDITEATYLQPPPDSILSTTDLIARRAIALQKRSDDLFTLHSKVFAARRNAALRFEKKHEKTIRDYDFKRGSLVLVRNTKIEKNLNRKMRPRYLGPLIVISRNKGGAYIICELDGTVLHRPIAAFRVIPYFARKSLPLPEEFLDIDTNRLREMEQSNDSIEEVDY
jgi:hypothetical protein